MPKKTAKVTLERLRSGDDFRAQVNLGVHRIVWAGSYGFISYYYSKISEHVRNDNDVVVLYAEVLERRHEDLMAETEGARRNFLEWFILHWDPEAYEEYRLYIDGRMPLVEFLVELAKPHLSHCDPKDKKAIAATGAIVADIMKQYPGLLPKGRTVRKPKPVKDYIIYQVTCRQEGAAIGVFRGTEDQVQRYIDKTVLETGADTDLPAVLGYKPVLRLN